MEMKVVIIENQQSHFQDIHGYLAQTNNAHEEFDIMPEESKYVAFTDLARIALDDRYSKDKKNNALEKLVKELKSFEPDILIVDHVLLGYTSIAPINPNGITLVESMMRKSNRLANVPVLFLSSTLRNNAVVQKQLKKIEQSDNSLTYEWENKNQFGQEGPFGGQDYFDKYIIPKMKKLVNNKNKTSKGKALFDRYNRIIKKAFRRAAINHDLAKLVNKKKRVADYIQNNQNSLSQQQYKITNSLLDSIEKIMDEEKPNKAQDKKIADIFRNFEIDPPLLDWPPLNRPSWNLLSWVKNLLKWKT